MWPVAAPLQRAHDREYLRHEHAARGRREYERGFHLNDHCWPSLARLYVLTHPDQEVLNSGRVSAVGVDDGMENNTWVFDVLSQRGWADSTRSYTHTGLGLAMMVDATRPRGRCWYHGGKWKLAPWLLKLFRRITFTSNPSAVRRGVLMRKPRSYGGSNI